MRVSNHKVPFKHFLRFPTNVGFATKHMHDSKNFFGDSTFFSLHFLHCNKLAQNPWLIVGTRAFRRSTILALFQVLIAILLTFCFNLELALRMHFHRACRSSPSCFEQKIVTAAAWEAYKIFGAVFQVRIFFIFTTDLTPPPELPGRLFHPLFPDPLSPLYEPQRILSPQCRSKPTFFLLAVFFAVQRIGASCLVQQILMSRSISSGTQIDFDSLIVIWFNSVSADDRKCTGPELVLVCSKVHIYVLIEITWCTFREYRTSTLADSSSTMQSLPRLHP